FGAAFGPLIILSLYNRNITKFGAISGMVVGALTVIIWKQLEGGIFDIFELLPGFIFSWIAILLFSKYRSSNTNSVSIKFDEVQKKLKGIK
ncbi:MAG: sodium:proline symporter, partial [Campylobacterota bacterium]|nr:sodium:proline symporter [Campylobacterota bacterium]